MSCSSVGVSTSNTLTFANFPDDPPKVNPFSLQLQFPRSLVFQRAQLFDFFGIDPVRNANLHIHMEQHAISPRRGSKHRS